MNKENLRQISSLIVAGSILSTPISAIPEQPVSRSLNSTEYETRLASANIQARINSQPFSHQGEYLNTQLGERTTFTCRRLIVPNKAYNQPLTTAELKRVETTWVGMNIDIPENMTGVIFAHGLRQDDKKYDHGVLMTLATGHYQFKIRNGEVVIWHPHQEIFQTLDLHQRIFEEIRHGNFDINHRLDLFQVSPDLASQIPSDLIDSSNIGIANPPKTN